MPVCCFIFVDLNGKEDPGLRGSQKETWYKLKSTCFSLIYHRVRGNTVCLNTFSVKRPFEQVYTGSITHIQDGENLKCNIGSQALLQN